MTTKRDEPAFGYPDSSGRVRQGGLTKREYFAAMAMQGLLAADTDACMEAEDAGRLGVLHADALIAALNDGGGE